MTFNHRSGASLVFGLICLRLLGFGPDPPGISTGTSATTHAEQQRVRAFPVSGDALFEPLPREDFRIAQGFLGQSVAGMYHLGADYCVVARTDGQGLRGTRFYPIASGRVVEVRFDEPAYRTDGVGNYIIVDHFNGTVGIYMHVARPFVSKGSTVAVSDALGEAGDPVLHPYPNCAHLHLEIRSTGALALNVAPNRRYSYAYRDGRTGFEPPLVIASVRGLAADRKVREWINENFLSPSRLRSRELLPGGPSPPTSGPPSAPITPTPTPSLSGRWDVVYDWTFSRCLIPPGFCTKCTTPHSYSVIQTDDVLRGVSVDSQAAEIVGALSGNSVRLTLTESFSSVCTRTFSLRGTLAGRRVTGTVSGGDDRCRTCRIDGTFAIEIK